MGEIRWAITNYGDSVGKTATSLGQSTSGKHTSSGTASDIAGLDIQPGQILEITSNTSGWINAKGPAAAGTGRPLKADQMYHYEAVQGASGTVSVIDD